MHSKKHYILPNAQRVLVFAPHMDDESIGCGGALTMYGRLGSELNIVFLTNGKKAYSRDSIPLRREESLRATSCLGARGVVYFDLPDNALEFSEELIQLIQKQLLHCKPDIVFAPNANDLHNDHIITSISVAEAMRRNGGGEIAYYEIWNPISKPNCFINITNVVSDKIRLIKCYHSQIEKYNLIKLFLSLNSYRAALLPFKQFRFVEAFLLQKIDAEHQE